MQGSFSAASAVLACFLCMSSRHLLWDGMLCFSTELCGSIVQISRAVTSFPLLSSSNDSNETFWLLLSTELIQKTSGIITNSYFPSCKTSWVHKSVCVYLLSLSTSRHKNWYKSLSTSGSFYNSLWSHCSFHSPDNFNMSWTSGSTTVI